MDTEVNLIYLHIFVTVMRRKISIRLMIMMRMLTVMLSMLRMF